MKNLFVFLCAVILAVGCQTQSQKFTITGTYEPSDSIVSINLVQGFGVNDTITIAAKCMETDGNDGTFSFSGRVNTPYIAQIAIREKIWGGVVTHRKAVLVEPGSIVFSMDKESIMKVSGSELNDRLSTVEARMMAIIASVQNLTKAERDEKIASYAVGVINSNLDNPIGLIYIKQVIIGILKSDDEVVLELLSKFTDEMQQSQFAESIRDMCDLPPVDVVGVGSQYIDFTLRDTNDKEVALSSLIGDGRWVLLDFWATWCQPCMSEIPKLKAAYEIYQPYGLEICGVSVAESVGKWREYCEANLPWVNLIDSADVVKATYQVKGIPTNFLISPSGEIVAKDLRGSEIEDVLSKFVKK